MDYLVLYLLNLKTLTLKLIWNWINEEKFMHNIIFNILYKRKDYASERTLDISRQIFNWSYRDDLIFENLQALAESTKQLNIKA